MRKFKYIEPDNITGKPVEVFVTEDYIIEHYYPYWYKRTYLTDKEKCIQDFITLNWAEEIT